METHTSLLEFVNGSVCVHEEALESQDTLRRLLVDVYPSICAPFGWSDQLYDLGLAIRLILKIELIDDPAMIEDWIIPHVLHIARTYYSVMDEQTIERLEDLKATIYPRLQKKVSYMEGRTLTEYEFRGNFIYFPLCYFVLLALYAPNETEALLAKVLGQMLLNRCKHHENFENISEWYGGCCKSWMTQSNTKIFASYLLMFSQMKSEVVYGICRALVIGCGHFCCSTVITYFD